MKSRILAVSLLGFSLSAYGATDCNLVTEIPKIECEALLAFYTSTNGEVWNDNKEGWNKNNNPCSWSTVNCLDGHVRGIQRSFTQLSGSIPAEIGNLSRLEFLDLSGNRLGGSIPEEIGNLSRLEFLDLSGNQFCGNIPESLTSLSAFSMSFMDISQNNLSVNRASETLEIFLDEYAPDWQDQNSPLICEANPGDDPTNNPENNHCDYLYGVHDAGLNNSQLIRYKADSGIEVLGDRLANHDIEALDISPEGVLYGAAGDNTNNPGYLYTFDMATGTVLSASPTGCRELDGLSFNPSDGSLWGWDQEQGLVQIIDGHCSSVLPNSDGLEIEDLSWDNAGNTLYFAYNDHNGADPDSQQDSNAIHRIGKYSNGSVDWQVCDIQSPEIEALEMMDADTLLIGYHDNDRQFTQLVDLLSCHVTTAGEVSTYRDIEGLAVCLPSNH